MHIMVYDMLTDFEKSMKLHDMLTDFKKSMKLDRVHKNTHPIKEIKTYATERKHISSKIHFPGFFPLK